MAATRRRLIGGAAGGALAVAAVMVARGGGGGGGGSSHGGAPATERSDVLLEGATSRTTDQFGLGDIGVLGFLLTLEHIEVQLYRQGLASRQLSVRTRDVAATFAREEDAHVARLLDTIHALGGHRLPPRPHTHFPLVGELGFLQVAATIESVVAAACLGQVDSLDTREALATVLAIHAVDARHSSAVNLMVGRSPAPDGAFAKPIDAATALVNVRPFLSV
jgi:hypothetical protein